MAAVGHADQEKVYWTDLSRIQRANLDGSEVEELVSDAGFAGSISLDRAAGKMYWAAGSPGSIWRKASVWCRYAKSRPTPAT